MFNQTLHQAVMDFAALMLPLSEKDLEHEWKWKDHDEEGIRFALFVTLQELRHLAVMRASVPPCWVSRMKMQSAPRRRENGPSSAPVLTSSARILDSARSCAMPWKVTAPTNGRLNQSQKKSIHACIE
jgi:hypothetical protein